MESHRPDGEILLITSTAYEFLAGYPLMQQLQAIKIIEFYMDLRVEIGDHSIPLYRVDVARLTHGDTSE